MEEIANLSFLMDVDGYGIFIDESQQKSYEQATDNDELTGFGVWIRVVLADDDMFDEEDDMLINATYCGIKSNLVPELRRFVQSERFTKAKQFSLDFDNRR